MQNICKQMSIFYVHHSTIPEEAVAAAAAVCAKLPPLLYAAHFAGHLQLLFGSLPLLLPRSYRQTSAQLPQQSPPAGAVVRNLFKSA